MDVLSTPADAITRVDFVIQTVRQRIQARSLTPGARLPSLRLMADSLGVSKSTVVEAYDRLVAEGDIRSQRGSGFFVAGNLPPLSMAEIGPRLDRALDPFWISRQSLESDQTVLKPGCGWLPASWLPTDELRAGLRRLARGSPEQLTDYASPQGLLPLRELLARRCARQGLDVGADQILLMESGTQAIDLLCRFLLEPGDVVLVDDPCYFNFHALLRAHRVQVVGVPYLHNGPDVQAFEQVVSTSRPRLYITNSGLHNPTGASLSAVTAHKILKIVDQYRMTVIEDDIFADMEMNPAARLAAFDGLDNVIQIGSFSKTLSASVRCGYIVVKRPWIEDLTDLKIATVFNASALASQVIFDCLKNGSYRKSTELLRQRLAQAMDSVVARLAAVGITPWLRPGAGMFLWCKLPDGVNAAQLARNALAENIVLAPGNVFSLSQTADRYMRINVAQCDDPRLYEFFRKARRLAESGQHNF
jgi:DNA-binding transcriptional MocR family regulator